MYLQLYKGKLAVRIHKNCKKSWCELSSFQLSSKATYPNALQQGVLPSRYLMNNKDQFYLCGVESGSYSWNRNADIGSALKVVVKAIPFLCDFLFFLLWVGVEENAQRLTLRPYKQYICENHPSWWKEYKVLSKQVFCTLRRKVRQDGSLALSLFRSMRESTTGSLLKTDL